MVDKEYSRIEKEFLSRLYGILSTQSIIDPQILMGLYQEFECRVCELLMHSLVEGETEEIKRNDRIDYILEQANKRLHAGNE